MLSTTVDRIFTIGIVTSSLFLPFALAYAALFVLAGAVFVVVVVIYLCFIPAFDFIHNFCKTVPSETWASIRRKPLYPSEKLLVMVARKGRHLGLYSVDGRRVTVDIMKLMQKYPKGTIIGSDDDKAMQEFFTHVYNDCRLTEPYSVNNRGTFYMGDSFVLCCDR